MARECVKIRHSGAVIVAVTEEVEITEQGIWLSAVFSSHFNVFENGVRTTDVSQPVPESSTKECLLLSFLVRREVDDSNNLIESHSDQSPPGQAVMGRVLFCSQRSWPPESPGLQSIFMEL